MKGTCRYCIVLHPKVCRRCKAHWRAEGSTFPGFQVSRVAGWSDDSPPPLAPSSIAEGQTDAGGGASPAEET